MPTSLMWKALDSYERYFRLNWSCPYRWDSKARKIIYNGNLNVLKGWMIAQFIAILNLSSLVGCLGACNFSKSCSFLLTELMIIATWTAQAVFTISLDVIFFLYSEDAIFTFNRLKENQSRLLKQGRRCWAQGQEKWDVIGNCYQVFAMMFAVYPYFLTFFSIIIFDVDPMYYGARQLRLIPFFHSHFFLRLTFILMRLSLAYPVVIQGSRVYAFLGIAAKIQLGMMMDSIQELRQRAEEIAWERRSPGILRDHAELKIVLKMAQPFLNPAGLVAMSVGLALDVLVNYATMKLYGTIPMPFYLFFPSVSFLIPTVVQLLLPTVVAIVEADKRLHQEWAYHAKYYRDKKYLRRKLRSVRAVKLYAGLPGTNIFPIVSSTKRTYYRAMIDYTISALLSFR